MELCYLHFFSLLSHGSHMQGSGPARRSPCAPQIKSWGTTAKPEHFSAQLRNLGKGVYA